MPDRRSRNKTLDGARGLAAVAVIFYHCVLGADLSLLRRVLPVPLVELTQGSDLVAKLALVIFNGETAVVIFFVLSGAVLLESLKHAEGGPHQIAWTFITRRFFRIYPALATALLGSAFLFALIGMPFSGTSLIENLVLYDSALLGATWTLNVEALATPLVLACFLAYRRWKEAGLIAVGLTLCLVIRSEYFRSVLIYFRPYAITFVFGMIVPTRIGAMLCSHLPKGSWICFLILMLFAKHTFPIGNRTGSLIQEISAALFIAMIYYEKADGLKAMLSNAAVQGLGKISYSLYLFNATILAIIFHWIKQAQLTFEQPLVAGLILGSFVTLVTTPIALAAFKFIEVPAIALGGTVTAATSPRRIRRPAS